MLSNYDTQQTLISVLQDDVKAGTLPRGAKIDTYAGQIDIASLDIAVKKYPAILVNWQGDAPFDLINEEKTDELNFTLLICTNSVDGLGDALKIVDTLKTKFMGQWSEGGVHMFTVYKGSAKPVINLKRRQVVAFPLRISE